MVNLPGLISTSSVPWGLEMVCGSPATPAGLSVARTACVRPGSGVMVVRKGS